MLGTTKVYVYKLPTTPQMYTRRVKHTQVYPSCVGNMQAVLSTHLIYTTHPRSIQAMSSTPQVYNAQAMPSTPKVSTSRVNHTTGLYKPCQAHSWSNQAVPSILRVYTSTP